VEDGTVPVDNLLHVLGNLQGAVRRLAESILDESRGRRRGRPSRSLAEETTLRLVSVGRGSFTAVLELPAPPMQQKMWDVGEQALENLLAGLEAVAEKHDYTSLPAVAIPEVQRLTQVVGDGITSLSFEGGTVRQHVARFEAPAEIPFMLESPRRSGSLSGRLREVDFKDHTAELYDATGRMTRVRFLPEQEDDLKTAANLHVTIMGEVEEGAGGKPASITVESVEAVPSADEFWLRKDIDRLAEEQGVGPLDASRLEPAPFWPKRLDPDDFVSAIYEGRRHDA
jgi:hypothetical protein